VYAHRSYKSLAAAKDRYRKLTTAKKIESWGESAGRKRNPSRKRKAAKRCNPKRRARNAPLSASEKRSLRSVLKKHGYLR
jgi:hypothetical protein